LVRKPEGKRLLRRPMGRWDDNIKMDHFKTAFEDVDWINIPQTGTGGGILKKTMTFLRVL
jgi:hypothetical protein